MLLSVNFACVIGDKVERCHLFLLKQEIAMDFTNEGSDIKNHYVILFAGRSDEIYWLV